MTAFTTIDQQAPPDAGIKRDRWGRYLIQHPVTGKQQAWTRATTVAGRLANRFGLEAWDDRNIVVGIGARQDLYPKAATFPPKADWTKDEKAALNAIAREAKAAAKAASGANLGTALHRFTERVDSGQPTIAPPPWDADIAAYQQAMAAYEVTVVPEWIERILLVPELNVAGTCDRLLTRDGWPLPRIGDVKTGKDAVKYMEEIPAQLAIYAHATHWYDPETGDTHEIKEHVDQDWGVVMHLPVQQARCTLHEINIKAGWDAVVDIAMKLHEWQNRNDLCRQLVPTRLEPTPKVDVIPQESLTWLHQRVEAIKAAGHGGQLAAQWSKHPDIPTFPRGGPTTNQQFWAVADMCEEVETDTGMPFGPPSPQATTRAQRAQHPTMRKST